MCIMQELFDYNYTAYVAKLDKVTKICDSYCVQELLEIVSDSPTTDMRVISDFDKSCVVLHEVIRGAYKRKVRFITLKGLKEYALVGHCYNIKNFCKYFNIKQEEPRINWSKYYNNGWNSRMLCKLIMGRRHTTTKLLPYDDIHSIIKYLEKKNYNVHLLNDAIQWHRETYPKCESSELD
jgi:hypothetical protein